MRVFYQFFFSFLFNVILKQKIDLKTNGATVKYVSISELKNLEIPVPPLELQQQFAAFVQQIDKSKFEIENTRILDYNISHQLSCLSNRR